MVVSRFIIKCLPLYAIFSIYTLSTRAQSADNFYIKTFTTENGLPHNQILSITKDNTGFLWIATWDGLSRFDGYKFKNYFHIPDDSTSVAYFLIRRVFCDSVNNVWLFSENKRLNLYKRETDNFKLINLLNLKFSFLDYHKKMWCCAFDGIYKFNYTINNFEKVEIEDSTTAISAIYKTCKFFTIDNEDNLWIHEENIRKYRLVIDYKTKKRMYQLAGVYSVIYKDGKNYSDALFQIYNTGNRTWLFTNCGLYSLDLKDKKFKNFSGQIPVNEFSNFKDGTLVWYNNGLHVIIPGEHKIFKIDKEIAGIPLSVYVEKNKSVWYGSNSITGYGLGLKCFIPTPDYFRHYLIDPEDNVAKVAIFSVLKDKNGDVWTNSRGKNFIFRIKPTGEIIKYPWEHPLLGRETDQVRTMAEDSSGIWFGNDLNLLTHYAFKTNAITQHFINDEVIDSEYYKFIRIHNILKSDNSNIIIGSGSIYEYASASKSLTMKWSPDYKTQLGYCLIRDSKKNYWLGKDSSRVYRVSSDYKNARVYNLLKEQYNIESICEDVNDEMWIATLGAGICKLNVNTGKIESYTTAHGLANNTTYSILRDKKGYLWITSNNGISRLNPVTRQFRNFGFTDGLKIEEFNSDAAFEAKDGEFFFGGMGGIVSFYPDSITERDENNAESRLIITDIKISGVSRYFNKPVYESSSIRLQKGDNNFTISYSCMNLKDADKIRYRYRIKTLNSKWIVDSNNQRFVSYTNVIPGSYTIEIEATDIMGNWKYNTELNIHIPAYFYQTIWFKILLFVLIIVFLVLIGYLYLRQVRLKEKQANDHLRLESLRGQMNPHFIFNSLNSINYFISQNDRLSANRYIADFSRLIRSILDNMACNYITFDKELESIKDYLKLEHLRFSDKFDYQVIVSNDIIPENIELFPGMVQPFIENAIWHGVRGLESRRGNITVRFIENSQKLLQCIVEDDGVGRQHSTVNNNHPGRRSRGIGIINERLNIYNNLWNCHKKIVIEDMFADRKDRGTRVTIDIPIKLGK